MWDYKKADTSNIRKAPRLFNDKNIDAQVTTFNETILNVFRNCIPNKYITVCINENIRSKMKSKNLFYI